MGDGVRRPPAVAIVGMGAVFPGAGDVPTFWRNICDGYDAITDVPAGRWDPAVYFDPTATATTGSSDRFYCRRGGFVDDLATFDPTAYGIMPASVDGTEPDQLLALRTATEAIADAGGESQLPGRDKIGVVIGRGGYITPASARMDQRVRTAHQVAATLREVVPGIDEAQVDQVVAAFREQLGPITPEGSIGLVPNFAASRIANRFDFKGPAYTVDAACASSLVAVDQAVRELESGRCDAMLAGAVHHCHLATLWSVFTQLGALSVTQQIRPFDSHADGTLMSEGTGMVLLKRLADAERDGNRVYAVIRGTGLASDGRASSLMSPLADGQVLAVEQAWRQAGLDPTAPDALGLVEAHGTATPAGDAVELATLGRVFGPRAGERIGLGTVKSMIGHAMPAAGMAGLIKAALAVHHGVRPPTLHVAEPHPAFEATRFRPLAELEPWSADRGAPRRAAVNAFGFGGINAHVVLEEASSGTSSPAFPPSPRAAPMELVLLLGADTADALATQLEATDGELLRAAGSSTGSPPAGRCRLGIVGPSTRSLALARKVVARGAPWHGRGDLWFTPSPMLPAGSIAFLFPGLEPVFEPHVADVAQHFGSPAPMLRATGALMDHALDIIAVGRFLADALAEIGVTPDLMAGHSLGEWTAMIVSGIYERSSIDAFITSLEPGMIEVPDVIYAALGCGAQDALDAIGGTTGVAVSHDNCPHQSVICGGERAVAEVLDRLRARGVFGQQMPFRSGFHSPFLAPYLGRARAALDRIDLRRPTVPVWSATSVDRYPGTDDATRDLVIRHLLEPVRFGPLVRRLHDEGVRAFVQVGPGSLPGFVDDTLDRDPYLVVAANTPERSGMAQLQHVAAALWTEGREIRWSALRGDTAPVAPQPDRSVRLDLGSPIVRMNGSAPKLGVSRPPTVDASAHPVLAQLAEVLTEADVTARAVVSAWEQRDTARAQPPTPTPVPPAASSVTTEFSLETCPDLVDHCLLSQPEGWPDASDRFPVVPLTTLLEIMGRAAADLVPGSTVVGYSNVEAIRWLVVAPPTTAAVTARQTAPDQVRVTVEGFTTGTVLIGATHPVPGEPDVTALTGARPPVVSAGALYAERWMFHGPAFAGIREITAVADDGISGVIEVLPASGALLDCVGQLVGHWMQICVDVDRTVFPVGVDRIELSGPPPAVGDRVSCTGRVRVLTPTAMAADAEVCRSDGTLWARVVGWKTHRFATDDVTWEVKRRPEQALVGEPQPGDWILVRERWPGIGTRDLTMRRYLNAAERNEYASRSSRSQRQWLLGRVAVKDAVRSLLWSTGWGPMYPAEITVSNHPDGQPAVDGPWVDPVHVSIAHSGELGVAMASFGSRVGIDVELVEERSEGTEAIALTDGERMLLAAQPDRALGLTRFWAAKEAVAKMRGTGLGGRPRDFEITSASGAQLVVVVDGRKVPIRTEQIVHGNATYVVAWTTPTNEGGADAG